MWWMLPPVIWGAGSLLLVSCFCPWWVTLLVGMFTAGVGLSAWNGCVSRDIDRALDRCDADLDALKDRL